MAIKILTVDDSKAIRKIIFRALEQYDCDVIEAENGAEGLIVSKKHKPDLIILDITMPVMNGIEMLEKLKADAELKNIPVIMLTAESNKNIVVQIVKLGVKDYLVKPFNAEQFINKVSLLVNLVLAKESSQKNDISPKVLDNRGNQKELNCVYEWLQDKEKQPFTINREDRVVKITIYPHFNEEYLHRFELAVEIIALLNAPQIILDLSPLTELDKSISDLLASKIKWIKDCGCSVKIISSGSDQEDKSVYNYIRKCVFNEVALLEEQKEKLKNQGGPFAISKQKDTNFVQFGEAINSKKSLVSFGEEIDKVLSSQPQRIVFDFSCVQVVSDTMMSEFIIIIGKIKENGKQIEFICNNIDLRSHIQSRIPNIKCHQNYDSIKF